MYGYEIFHDDLMKNLIALRRKSMTSNAYIFQGEEGVGKRRAAALFASALVCENDTLAPCTTCHACTCAGAGTNPDIKYINSGDKKSIGVDVMREIVNDAYIRPFESAKKVYIIEDGLVMTEQAQNAFLKMLEEPPQYSVFIILTESLSGLLSTIISRCTTVRFTSPDKDRVIGYIKTNYPDADYEFLARYTGNNPGKVDRIMESEDFFPLREKALRLVPLLVSENKMSAYKIADFLEENKESVGEIFKFWQSMLRDMIFIGNNAGKFIINSDIEEDLKELRGKIDERILYKAEKELNKATEMLRRYVNLRALSLALAFSIKNDQGIKE